MLTEEQFNAEIAKLRAIGNETVQAIEEVDAGSTEQQLAATAPRSPEEIKSFNERHEEEARKSSLAEAQFLAAEALSLFKMLAKAGVAL